MNLLSIFKKRSVEAIKADITKLRVDCIVNAAKSSLLGGGGVDGAIHKAAGPELLNECKTLGGCPTGCAKSTKGYNLPAKFVIHTVGPVWQGGEYAEPALLSLCYVNSLQIAEMNKWKTIAFPSISTGVYGYPIDLAAKTAVETVKHYFKLNHSKIKKVIFCCFSDSDLEAYKYQLRRLS